MRRFIPSALLSLLLLTSASTSWAWGRFGFRGAGLGIVVAPWWYGPYDPYYGDPYYGPYDEPRYYTYVPDDRAAASHPPAAPASPPSKQQLAQERAQIDFELDDGDITQAEHDTRIRRLQELEKPASEAPAPPSAPSVVEDQIKSLRVLLHKKVADHDITLVQARSMNQYLIRIEKKARADATANHGALTPDQEEDALRQLGRVKESITNNFISN